MQRVEEPPVETIHLYVVREEEPKPSLLPIVLSVFALFCVIAVGVAFPYQQPEIRTTIRVPAVLFPLQTFSTEVSIIPTGIKNIPATTAQGFLTIYNGSAIRQEITADMIFVGNDGVEIVADKSADIPAANPPSYGTAVIPAHAITAGVNGNIQALDINKVYGSSLYIRNLQPFTGGKESFTVTFVTSQDMQRAIEKARGLLIQHTLAGLLESPCKEIKEATAKTIAVKWTCQFVTYEIPHLPQVRVLHATVEGKNVVLDVVYVERPRILTGK